MGMHPSADLVFGFVVGQYTKPDPETWESEPTPYWDENMYGEGVGDWRFSKWDKKDGEIIVTTFGHCEDPEPRAILTLRSVPQYDGDAWTAGEVPFDLSVSRSVIQEANEEAKALGLDVDFNDAKWLLVASYG